jgi:hypothetical protein
MHSAIVRAALEGQRYPSTPLLNPNPFPAKYFIVSLRDLTAPAKLYVHKKQVPRLTDWQNLFLKDALISSVGRDDARFPVLHASERFCATFFRDIRGHAMEVYVAPVPDTLNLHNGDTVSVHVIPPVFPTTAKDCLRCESYPMDVMNAAICDEQFTSVSAGTSALHSVDHSDPLAYGTEKTAVSVYACMCVVHRFIGDGRRVRAGPAGSARVLAVCDAE